jgi:predicted type IV restriction endonuclease
LLQELGWPVFDPTIVSPEYGIEGRRVDYALCHPANKPVVFIEVKQPGKSEGADRQLFEYAFHQGVPLALLTDGREWHFYLPAGQGLYHERRVYKLDIVERDVAESEGRLLRYLSYGAVTTGEAHRAAQDDYDSLRKDREIEAAIPKAWLKLIEDKDELLVELIADQVESLCGYRPEPDLVTGFLSLQTRYPQAEQFTPLGPSLANEGNNILDTLYDTC